MLLLDVSKSTQRSSVLEAELAHLDETVVWLQFEMISFVRAW